MVALLLAGFAMAFGTRRVDASEHQNGLMLTIAAESALKLVAFLAVGAFVVWGMFDGLSDLFHRAVAVPRIRAVLAAPPDFTVWTTLILLSSGAMLFLPRQFHVAVVENRAESDIQSASVTFPLYLLAINFFVVPLSIAGLVLFPEALDRDVGVMALPIIAENGVMSLIAMLGGLSAATAMVVVESIALSIMVSNNLVIPLLLRLGRWRQGRRPAPFPSPFAAPARFPPLIPAKSASGSCRCGGWRSWSCCCSPISITGCRARPCSPRSACCPSPAWRKWGRPSSAPWSGGAARRSAP